MRNYSKTKHNIYFTKFIVFRACIVPSLLTDAYVTEEETGEGDGIYMYKPIAADAFTYDIAQTDLGDQTFTLKNVSDQSYSYVSADILFYNADDEIMDYYQGVSFSEVMAGGEQIMRNCSGTGTWRL